MRLHRVWFTFIPVLVLICSVSSSAFGAAIFFSTIGPPSTVPVGIPDPSVVPTVALNAGQTGTLHIWIKPDGTRPPAQTFNNVTWNIETTNSAAATPTSHVVVNPLDLDEGTGRWDGTSNGFPGSGNNWVLNAFGLSSGSKSVGNSNAANTTFLTDPEYHAASRSFYLGTLNFQATNTPGAAGQSTRLYFRTGSSLNSLRNGATVPISFGADAATYTDTDGTTGGLGDPISNPAMADAIINVAGIVGGTATIGLTPLGSAAADGDVRLINPLRGEFRNANGLTQGRVNVSDFHGENSGNLTVFFDLADNGQAAAVIAELQAAAAGLYTVLPSSFQGTNRDTGLPATADLAVQFTGRGTAGSDQYIDFNFQGRAVAAVGVPEPSTYLMAAMGLVGLALGRRRKG